MQHICSFFFGIFYFSRGNIIFLIYPCIPAASVYQAVRVTRTNPMSVSASSFYWLGFTGRDQAWKEQRFQSITLYIYFVYMDYVWLISGATLFSSWCDLLYVTFSYEKLFTTYVLDQQIFKLRILNFKITLGLYVFQFWFYMIFTLSWHLL